MSIETPTVDDLRLVASNLKAEGHSSRALFLEVAADHFETVELGADKLTKAFAEQAETIAALRARISELEAALREILTDSTWDDCKETAAAALEGGAK